MLQHLIIQFPLYNLSSGHLLEVKKEENFKKSDHGCLREVAAYKRLQI